jgi:hypothetical protein
MNEMKNEQAHRFAQMDRRAAINTLFETPWITLYRCDGEENWFSGLVVPEKLAKALSDQSWDLHWGQMRPCVVAYGLHDDAEMGYERFQDDGFEPIVIARERGNGPFFVELAEDIRLFLNLFPGENGNLVRSDENGDEEVVATVTAQEVRIRKGPLLRYLQARQIYLAAYFDHVLHLDEYGDNPLPEEEQYVDVREADRAWSFGSCDDAGSPFSRLCGKRLLAPPPRESRAERDGDQSGQPFEHSADPKGLANFFGKNPKAPNYLTPVHFKREVLDRYFHNPGKYAVSDGMVRNDPHWVFRMDDDHSGRVLAFLGDLGRDLPYTEQLHWRAHNILPDGGLSRTAQSRSFDARPADGEQPEHRFKTAFQRFNTAWLDAHGWPLFRPLAPGDRHLLTRLHVPTSDNPAELDAQLVGLAKILIDRLNDAGLNSALASPVADERSLAKLKRYLAMRKYPEIERDVGALSAIQGLRSTGAAHARGSNYTRVLKRRCLEGQSAPVIVSALIEDAITMLHGFAALCKG